jgi:hypothetical protein
MKTEEATCKVAPSPTQISYPLYNVKDGVIEGSPHTAVTCSPFSIGSPQTQSLYITPRSEKTPKEHNFAYYKTLVALFAGIDQRITFFDAVLLNHMVAFVRRKDDGFMISGIEKVGNALKGQSKRATLESLKRLEKFGYLYCFQRGIGRGNASKYVLGEMYSKDRRNWIEQRLIENAENAKPQNFVRTKPKGKSRGRPFRKGEKVQKSAPFNDPEKVQISAQKRCKYQHLHPIGNPIYTHTESKRETSSPDRSLFNLENWLYRGKEKLPDWDNRDLMGSYESAVRNGVNGTWELYQDKCYARRFNASPDSPRSSPAPRPAVKSSCESPKQARLDYNDPKILEEALFVALSNGETTACILASVKDPALAYSARAKAEARIETSRNRSRMP